MPACTLCLRNCELHCERESACTMGDAQGLAAWQAPYIVKVLDPGCTLIIVHLSAVCIRMHRQSRELAADKVGDQSCTHPPSPLIRHHTSSSSAAALSIPALPVQSSHTDVLPNQLSCQGGRRLVIMFHLSALEL